MKADRCDRAGSATARLPLSLNMVVASCSCRETQNRSVLRNESDVKDRRQLLIYFLSVSTDAQGRIMSHKAQSSSGARREVSQYLNASPEMSLFMTYVLCSAGTLRGKGVGVRASCSHRSLRHSSSLSSAPSLKRTLRVYNLGILNVNTIVRNVIIRQ